MIVSIIDLGTNKFKLKIYKIFEDGVVNIIHHKEESVFITNSSLNLNESNANKSVELRVLDAFYNLNLAVKEFNSKLNYCIATSAFRTNNDIKQIFIKLKNKYDNFDFKIINGDEEANLNFLGVKYAVNINEKSLIVDIGGGSTEIVIANNNEIDYSFSFEVGVARYRNKYNFDNKLSEKILNEIQKDLEEKLSPLPEKINVKNLYGTAGVFSTLTNFSMVKNNEKKFNNFLYKIDYNFYLNTYDKIINSNKEDRLKIQELEENRVDYIVQGLIISKFVIDKYSIKNIYYSQLTLADGYLIEILKEKFKNITFKKNA